jgi:hypothetical protein
MLALVIGLTRRQAPHFPAITQGWDPLALRSMGKGTRAATENWLRPAPNSPADLLDHKLIGTFSSYHYIPR